MRGEGKRRTAYTQYHTYTHTYTHTQIYTHKYLYATRKRKSNKPDSHKDAIHSLDFGITLKTLTTTQRVVRNFPHNNLPAASVTSDRKIKRRRRTVNVFSPQPTLAQKFRQDVTKRFIYGLALWQVLVVSWIIFILA